MPGSASATAAVTAAVPRPDAPSAWGRPGERVDAVLHRLGADRRDGRGARDAARPAKHWSRSQLAQPVSSHVPITLAMHVWPSRRAAASSVRLAAFVYPVLSPIAPG